MPLACGDLAVGIKFRGEQGQVEGQRAGASLQATRAACDVEVSLACGAAPQSQGPRDSPALLVTVGTAPGAHQRAHSPHCYLIQALALPGCQVSLPDRAEQKTGWAWMVLCQQDPGRVYCANTSQARGQDGPGSMITAHSSLTLKDRGTGLGTNPRLPG